MEKLEQENKYYTPEISEFHIGFEYEYLKNDWNKMIFVLYPYLGIDERSHLSLEIISKSITKEKIRVKYLDIQDIEDLGWDCDSIFPGLMEKENRDFFYYEIPGIDESNPNAHLLDGEYMSYDSYELHYNFTTREASMLDHSGDNVFRGIIKNKSQLFNLMKQLMVKVKW